MRSRYLIAASLVVLALWAGAIAIILAPTT